MNDNFKVGIYLRLSREDEKLGESGSITNQRAILMDYIKRNDLFYVDEYIDDGVSGTTFDRKGFKKMLLDIKDKRINMVITKDTSRLGRDHIEFGYYVEKFFPENNIRYVAVCDNIDTFFNNNDMLLFKSAYNDLYVRDISNKIRASLNIKKRNGEFVGAYAPYGYIKDINNKHRLIIDNEAALVVRKIFNLFIKGNSLSSIANILTNEKILIPSIYKNMNRGIKSSLFGVWNSSTVRDIITNPTYIGNLTQGKNKKISYKSKKRIHTSKDEWIITNNTCPAIIDKDIFWLANDIYNSNKYGNKKNTNFLLKGLVYCNECNHKIGFRSINNDKNRCYGSCNYYLKHRLYNVCTPHSIKYIVLEKIILLEIDILLKNINYDELLKKVKKFEKNRLFNNSSNELIKLEKELSLVTVKIDRLYDDRLSGLIGEEMYLRNYKKIIGQEAEMKKRKNELLKLKNNKVNIRKEFDKFIKTIKYDRRFISFIISKITLNENKDINIYFNIKNCEV